MSDKQPHKGGISIRGKGCGGVESRHLQGAGYCLRHGVGIERGAALVVGLISGVLGGKFLTLVVGIGEVSAGKASHLA